MGRKVKNIGDIDELITSELMKLHNAAAKYASIKMRAELSKAYKEMIFDFYSSYAPSYYRRHDIPHHYVSGKTKLGTATRRLAPSNNGVNLYFGDANRGQISKKINDSYVGSISLSADEMSGEHYGDSKEQVLGSVISGYRYRDVRYGQNPSMAFWTSYSTDGFSSSERTIYGILKEMVNKLWNVYLAEGYEVAKNTIVFTYIQFK